LPVLDYTI
jgi:hypothetical protein